MTPYCTLKSCPLTPKQLKDKKCFVKGSKGKNGKYRAARCRFLVITEGRRDMKQTSTG